LEVIRRLVEQFDLPADVLVKPYALGGGVGQTLSYICPSNSQLPTTQQDLKHPLFKS
jgi:hypothetical protein